MPDISKVRLPGSNTDYDIKDAVARQMISGGVSFIIAWDGTSVPTVANIPEGVKVTYSGTTYTGTLAADSAEAGAFYLVKSASQPSSETLDIYDEYVPAGTAGSKFWEKIGDTQLNLTDVVTGVTLSKQTDTVIGTDATFTITQPTVTISSGSSGDVTVATGGTTKYMAATASGAAVTPSTTYIKGTASGTAVGADGTAAAVTGYPNVSTDTFVKSVSAETNKNLVTTTVPNVTGNTSVSIPNVTGNTSVSASKISSNTSVTANKSTWSFTMGTGDASETLIIGGGNGSDVTATNTAYSDVTATNTTLGTNLTATNTTLGTAKTVATGETSTTGTGDAVVTGVTIGSSASAVTALGTPSTANALTGVKVTTQPTIALATDSSSGTGKVQVATGISSVTQPTIALSAESSSDTGRVQYTQSVSTTKISGTASGANTAWNNKDSVTVLKNTTDVSVTKGNA